MSCDISKIDSNVHSQQPIYSIDISPCSKYLATAGGDNKIKIWEMSIFNDQKRTVKSIFVLKNHIAPVNSVRWSHSHSKMIVSGSDDKNVIIWECPENIGEWKALFVLMAHKADVQGVSWSNDNKLVASCSVDNSIIIWNSKNGKKLKTLKSHKSWVIGCEFSPNGKILATKSANGVLVLWETENWAVIKKFSSFYEKCGILNLTNPSSVNEITFSRLSFSPNGQYLGTTRGLDNVFVSPIIDIQKLKHCYSFAGHSSSTSSIKFSQFAIKRKNLTIASLIAIGSEDNSISIWASDSNRPILILRNLFKKSILDISWHPKEAKLIICSFDGTIAFVRLKKCLKNFQIVEKSQIQNFEFSSINKSPKKTEKTKKIEKIKSFKAKKTIKNLRYEQFFRHFSNLFKITKNLENDQNYKIKSFFGVKNKKLSTFIKNEMSIVKIKNRRIYKTKLPFRVKTQFVSEKYFALATENRIFLYNNKAILISPILRITPKILFVFLKNSFLSVCCNNGDIQVWKIDDFSQNVKNFYKTKYFENAKKLKQIIDFDILEDGNISVKIEKNKKFIFSKKLNCWTESFYDFSGHNNFDINQNFYLNNDLASVNHFKNGNRFKELAKFCLKNEFERKEFDYWKSKFDHFESKSDKSN